MFGKKHLMTVTVEVPYELEVAGNVSDIDETCRKKVSESFKKEFGIALDIERMYVRIEELDYVE